MKQPVGLVGQLLCTGCSVLSVLHVTARAMMLTMLSYRQALAEAREDIRDVVRLLKGNNVW